MSLNKSLNFIEVFAIASGAMISSGLFILPGLAYAEAGPSVFISYFIAGLLATTGMLSQAELASAMPKAGGTYFYVTRSLGPAIGTINGLMTWFSVTAKSAFALIGMAAFVELIFPELDIHILAIGLSIFFIVINILGVKLAGKMQTIMVFFLFLLLLLFIIKGIPEVSIDNFKNFMPNGINGIFATAGLVFVSYGGLLKIASIAEEVSNPGKTLASAMIASLIIVTIIYILTVFITVGIMDGTNLATTLTPISDAGKIILGKLGAILLSIAAILAFISTANSGILAASRYPLALSRDKLVPEYLSKINEKFKTPTSAIITTGLIIIVTLFFKIKLIVEVASTALIITYMLSCICLIILRESKIQNYRPIFKSPLYPWVQIAGIFGLTLMLFEMGKETILITTGIVLVSFSIYWFYGKARNKEEFALLHLIERVLAKDLTSRTLETELKNIIMTYLLK